MKSFIKKKSPRVLVKISGEILAGVGGIGADGTALLKITKELEALVKAKIEVVVVMGGGNFWRYRDQEKLEIPRSASDAIGMMATIMNARLLEEALNAQGIGAKALSAHGDAYFAESYSPNKGKEFLAQKKIVICAGGTGNPYFTTDSAAALRALELDCDILLKMTKVDGVFEKDPIKYPKAKHFASITYDDYLKRELQVMDLVAVYLCKANSLPIRVFQIKPGALLKAAKGVKIGSLISD